MKNKVGFFLPEPVEAAFDEAAERLVGGKEKWLVITAAILLLLEKSEAERGAIVRRVRAEAGKDGDFERLVGEFVPLTQSPPIRPPQENSPAPKESASRPRVPRAAGSAGKGRGASR
jgi:hypothetical protein